ncbi:hypothetical protein [Agarivorans sp. QJM3NY_33]|uniref:hypothetical protein n=1 Tax=Agarivorans sp. QJM3NY_33 TaxID=3421432 RepID=UPI003D7E3B28
MAKLSNQKTLLIVTVGTSDLKVVYGGEGNEQLLKIGPSFQRQFYDFLLDDRAIGKAFQLLSCDDVQQFPSLLKAIDNANLNERNVQSLSFNGNALSNRDKIIWSKAEEDALPLVAAKLVPFVHMLQQQAIRIDGALILNTDRGEASSFSKSEPYGAGAVVAQWFAQELGLEYGGQWQHLSSQPICGYSRFYNYINDEINDYKGHGLDNPVSRLAMQRVDDALGQLAKEFGTDAQLMYLSSGGFPEFKPQIQAAASLYFKQVSTLVEPGQGSAQANLSASQASWFDHSEVAPAESYRARRQVIDLIEHGNFEGAATTARLLYPNETSKANPKCWPISSQSFAIDQQWVTAVCTLAGWLQGKLPLQDVMAIFKGVLPYQNQPNSMPRSVWMAFKVEAALQQENVQDAVRYTCDLLDIAKYDLLAKVTIGNDFNYYHQQGEWPSSNNFERVNKVFEKLLKQHVTKQPSVKSPTVYENWGRLVEEPTLKAFSIEDFMSASTKSRRFILNDRLTYTPNNNWLKQYFLTELKQFQEEAKTLKLSDGLDKCLNGYKENRNVFLDVLCFTDKDDYKAALIHPVNRYEAALKHKLEASNSKARDYRNAITHGYLPDSMAHQVYAHFRAPIIGLWENKGEAQGQLQFLNQSLVKDLFSVFAKEPTQQPAYLYNALIGELKSLLTSSPISLTQANIKADVKALGSNAEEGLATN